MLGYTLNRITLFALVFVVGIVVDDSIIIAENMHRHFHMKKLPFKQSAIYAINEVGNPNDFGNVHCNCCHFTDGFRKRNDGTLYVSNANWCFYCDDAFIVCSVNGYPYLGYHLLKVKDDEEHKEEQGMETSKIYKIYKKKIEQPFLDSGKKTLDHDGELP